VPLNHEFVDKWGKAHPEAWSYCASSSFNWEGKAARLEFWTYTSKVDAYAGRPPLAKHAIVLNRTSTPAVLSSVVLVSPGSPAVYSEPDPETGEVVLVTEEVLPVYSEPTVLRPAVPSFGEVLAANSQAYGSLEASLANLASQVLPELAGATWEPVA
jgi:hypothetical protein